MNTILCFGLLVCATLAFTTAYPAEENAPSPALQPEEAAVEPAEGLETAESAHRGGGGGGWGRGGGGWGRGGGWGGGYGGGYGGGWGRGGGGYGGHGGYGRGGWGYGR